MTGAPFTIEGRDGAARAGLIHTPHGDVRTPAFVPLASTGTVKSLHASEVAALGYDMVLGNTFHLFIQPEAELVEQMGGLHEFMGWRRAIITDSGGYQVFSMGHGSVAEEIKRRRDRRTSMVLSIEEEGVRFRSYLDGRERFMGPETSMEVQAKLGSDIALAFDECTPFHVERDYTARSMERTHRWLERCIAWCAEHAPQGQLLYGIVQEGLRGPADRVDRLCGGLGGAGASRSAVRSDRRSSRCARWWGGRSRRCPTSRRDTCWESATWMISSTPWARAWTASTAPRPRLARHGTALVPDPEGRWRLDLSKSAMRTSREPIDERCPCPACREHTRGYLHYLMRANELTGKRLITLHNLTFMQRLMAGMREAILEGRFAQHAAAVLAGERP